MINKLRISVILAFTIVFTACSREFTIVQITDPQFGMFSENKGISEESLLYEKAINKINKLNPAFVFITGDLVHDRTNQSQWNEFKRITSLIDAKFYVTPGNHDIGQEPTEKDISAFREMFGYDRFSFTYRNCRFIGFNSNLIKAGASELEMEQREWLRKELESATGAKQVFLFCHHPFFINTPDEPEEYFNIKPEVRKEYLSMFEESGVDAIFAGHLHRNASSQAGNIQMITTSSAGKQLGRDKPGFRVVKVSKVGFGQEYIETDQE